MNRLLSSFLLLLPIIGLAQQTDSAQVSQLNRNWIASYATKDTGMMERILDSDFIMVSPKGTKLNKWDVIKNVGSPDVITTASIDSASVRVFGSTALVVAYTHFTIKMNGQTMVGSNCYSDLYVKRKGVWKAVGAHVTVLTTN